MDVAYEMNRIFTGNQRAHGEFVITSKKGAKATGSAKTVSTPPNEDCWRKHLAGEVGLGVVAITEKNNCAWGAVDIDEYDGIDLEDLSFKLESPLVLCRSKSGGAHVYLFTNEPVTAYLMRKKLALVSKALGFSNAELFPKQEKLDEKSVGNWINMPYFSGNETTRYCLKGGVALSVEEFIEYVAENSINNEQLVAFVPAPINDPVEDEEFKDAPPCLRKLIKTGFPTGSRNSALFSMGVYARMKFASGWEDRVFEYNQRFMGPGSYSEVAGVIRSLNKKSYVYKCKDQPLLSVCDKESCAECNYGVQPNRDDERSKRQCVLEEVELPVKCYAPSADSKDDPYWVFTINGVDIDVTVEMVRSQAVFSREYLRQYHRVVLPVKDTKWVKIMNELLENAEIHTLAPDAGPEGQLRIHLEEFCTNKSKARAKEELLIGKPWTEDGRIFFRSGDLMKYLDQQRFRSLKEKEIFPILKRLKAKHHSFHLKGKHIACWSVPSFEEQSEGFNVDTISDDERF